MNDQLTPDHILQLGLGFWGSKALLSAVELGVFSELAGGPQEGPALVERLALHPRGAQDFLDALVSLGMLERSDDRYSNAPAADLFLDRAKPSYLGGLLEMANARVSIRSGAHSPRRYKRAPLRTRSRLAAASSRCFIRIRICCVSSCGR